MFGILNRKKKIAEEISLLVLNTIRSCFVLSKYIDENGKFVAPNQFWHDDYVKGFVYALSGMFLNFDYGGASMKTQDKGDTISQVFMILCADDWKVVLSSANDCAISKSNRIFNTAVNDASTLYGVVSGRLKEDDTDPIVLKAKSLAEEMHKAEISMALMKGDKISINSIIGSLVQQITIGDHIRNKYLS